jgi:hypothetical protein
MKCSELSARKHQAKTSRSAPNTRSKSFYCYPSVLQTASACQNTVLTKILFTNEFTFICVAVTAATECIVTLVNDTRTPMMYNVNYSVEVALCCWDTSTWTDPCTHCQLWFAGIQVCSNEGDFPSPRGDNSETVKERWKFFLKNFLLQNQLPKINQTWYMLSLNEGNSSLFKWRVRSSSKGR